VNLGKGVGLRLRQVPSHVCCGQTVGWIKMALGMEVGLSPGDSVRWGPSHLSQKGRSPTQFSAHVFCGQTAARIKMLLGTEVGLGLRDIVFDVDPATPRKRGTPTSTQFLAHVYSGQMAGWMKTPFGTEVELGPGHIFLDGVPAPAKGAQQPPIFGPCQLWLRSPISATAELLIQIASVTHRVRSSSGPAFSVDRSAAAGLARLCVRGAVSTGKGFVIDCRPGGPRRGAAPPPPPVFARVASLHGPRVRPSGR